MSKRILSVERLRELLDYNPGTGEFKWRVDRKRGIKAGDIAGYKRPDGYIEIRIETIHRYAHRLAWLYVTGSEPERTVDHINGNRADNRFANLRDVPMQHNTQNKRTASSRNTSGLLGVARSRNKWSAMICVNGHRRRIGTFETPEDAHQAYVAAKRALHDGCTL